jgi:hypothetical protein
MPFTTAACGQARSEKIAALTLCRDCGVEMKCPTCEFGTAHVDGIAYSGFGEQASEAGSTLTPYLVQNMHMRAEEEFRSVINTGGVRAGVQLIATLFDIAAAMAAIEHRDATDADREKLRVLHRHAIEGISLIDPGNER